jgi:hypothetical protein
MSYKIGPEDFGTRFGDGVVTENIYPPIPRRNHDWVAYYEGDEEGGPRGYGRTENEARHDLLSNSDNPHEAVFMPEELE